MCIRDRTGIVSIGNVSVPVSFEADGTYAATFVSFTGPIAENGNTVELSFKRDDGNTAVYQAKLTTKQVTDQLAEIAVMTDWGVSTDTLAVVGKVYDAAGQVIKSGLTGIGSLGNVSVPVSFEADGSYTATFVSFTGSVASNGDVVELSFVNQDGDKFLRQVELTAKQVANQLADGLDFTAGTPPTVLSPTAADETAATSQSTDLNYSLTFSENLDYDSLKSSIVRMTNVTDNSGTFDMSLEAALANSVLGLEVKFWNAVSGGTETTANDVRRLDIKSSTVKLLEGKQYRIDLVANDVVGGTSTDGLKLVLPAHLADGFVFTTILSLAGDVNNDKVVDLLDLVKVAGQFGQSGADLAGDVNGDNLVDLLDLVKVAGNFGESREPASPTLLAKAVSYTHLTLPTILLV